MYATIPFIAQFLQSPCYGRNSVVISNHTLSLSYIQMPNHNLTVFLHSNIHSSVYTYTHSN